MPAPWALATIVEIISTLLAAWSGIPDASEARRTKAVWYRFTRGRICSSIAASAVTELMTGLPHPNRECFFRPVDFGFPGKGVHRRTQGLLQ